METTRISLDVPKADHKAFKKLCIDNDEHIQEPLLRYIKRRINPPMRSKAYIKKK